MPTVLNDDTGVLDEEHVEGAFRLPERARTFLYRSARIGNVIGVAGSLIFVLLILLLIVGMGYMMATGRITFSQATVSLLAFYTLLATISFIVYFFLLRFSQHALVALRTGSATAITSAFRALFTLMVIVAVLFVFYGMIFGLVFFANSLDALRWLRAD